MGTFDLVRDLAVHVDGYELERRTKHVSSGFTRVTTLVRLRGGGFDGLGEDVTYSPEDHEIFLERGTGFDVTGRFRLAEFSQRLAELDLFPEPPDQPSQADYRQWAFESAALDLALRQQETSLAGVLGREPRPVRFVVSLRIPEPPSVERVVRLREQYPGTRFKLDPVSTWTRAFMDQLHALRCVDVIDLKGCYEGTVVDQPPDASLYRNVAEAFAGAWIEDPRLTPETDAVLAPFRDRITWDAKIHSVADVESLPFPPRTLNVKPSRFGSVERLFDAYDWCAWRGIAMYGGGQFELDVARGQIQYLASLFHPDAPNDVAPGGYNDEEPADGLEKSPLAPRIDLTGFRRLTD